MRTLLIIAVAVGVASCSTGTKAPVATADAKSTKGGIIADESVPGNVALKPAPKDTNEGIGTFTVKPTPERLLRSVFIPRRVIQIDPNRLPESGTGSLYLNSDSRLRYEFKPGKGEGAKDSIAIDWNNDKNCDNDGIIVLPGKNETVDITAEVNGAERNLVLYRTTNPQGHIALYIRPAEWLEGTVIINGKPTPAAIMDTDLNGIDSRGSDRIIISSSHGGEFVYSPGQTGKPLSKQIYLRYGIFTVAVDGDKPTVTLTPAPGLGTISLSTPAEWKIQSLGTAVRVGRSLEKFTTAGSSFQLPAGKYRTAAIYLRGQVNGKKFKLMLRAPNLKVETGKTTALSVTAPTGVQPKVRLQDGMLNVRESMVFVTPPVGIEATYCVRTIDNKSTPTPRVEVYKGDQLLTQGAMRYG